MARVVAARAKQVEATVTAAKQLLLSQRPVFMYVRVVPACVERWLVADAEGTKPGLPEIRRCSLATNTDATDSTIQRDGANGKPEIVPPTLRIHRPDVQQSNGDGDNSNPPARGMEGIVIIIDSGRITIKM